MLIARTKAELAADFDFSKPYRITRAPGSLDIMGGVAEFTGSLVYRAAIDRNCDVLTQQRMDREIQIFSFNLYDEHRPFTFRISMDRLAQANAAALRAGFTEAGRGWAAYVAGCLAVLHWEKLIDLASPGMNGISFAIHSDIPMQMGLGSSAALLAATMGNLLDNFRIRDRIDSSKLVNLCTGVERELIGTSSSIASQATSCLGLGDGFLRVQFQNALDLQSRLQLPKGFQLVGICSGIRDRDSDRLLREHFQSASKAHQLILSKMREMGRAAGRELHDDPMRGFLANLDQDDYKKFFRAYLADPQMQGAADHHVLEARRVRQFCEFIERAGSLDLSDTNRFILMDKAGHLMYASHLSSMNDARLGAEQCDLLVNMVRAREKSSLYGARMTGNGCGGTVAVLSESSERANSAIAQIIGEFNQKTGAKAELIRITDQ